MTSREPKFFICDCLREAIAVDAWGEDANGDVDMKASVSMIILSLWSWGYTFHPSWRERLVNAMRRLKGEQSSADEVFLTPVKARELASYILDLLGGGV